MSGVIRTVAAWLDPRPACALLTADDRTLEGVEAARFARAWAPLVLISGVWGLANMAVWSAAWWIWGEYSGLTVMPAVAVTALTAFGPGRRALPALGSAIGGRDEAAGRVATSAIIVCLALAMLELKSWNPDWATWMPHEWRWVRPRALYRTLILAPVWGAWAMLILPQICRARERTEPAVAAMARGCGPLPAAFVLAIPLAATILYFNYLPWSQLSISAAAMVAALAGGVLLCRRFGGLTRRALLATNMLTQMAFVLAYLANKW